MGLMNKRKKDKADVPQVFHLKAEELKEMIIPFLEDGRSPIKIKKKLKRYRVNGRPIEVSDILKVKREQKQEAEARALRRVEDTEKHKLLRRAHKRAIKSGNLKRAKEIEDLLIYDAKKRSGSPTNEGSQKFYTEEDMRRVLAEQQKTIMRAKMNPSAIMLMDSKMLHADPRMASMQLFLPVFDARMQEAMSLVRELKGVKDAKTVEGVVTDAEVDQKVKEKIRQLEEIRQRYGRCDKCDTLVPKDAASCVACGEVYRENFKRMRRQNEGENTPRSDPPKQAEVILSNISPDERDRWLKPPEGLLWRLKTKIENGANMEHLSKAIFFGMMDGPNDREQLTTLCLLAREPEPVKMIFGMISKHGEPEKIPYDITLIKQFYEKEEAKTAVRTLLSCLDTEATKNNLSITEEQKQKFRSGMEKWK